MSLIKMAEQQLIGFAHGSRGYSLKELVTSMGLTASEWNKIRESVYLKESDILEMDDFFSKEAKRKKK